MRLLAYLLDLLQELFLELHNLLTCAEGRAARRGGRVVVNRALVRLMVAEVLVHTEKVLHQSQHLKRLQFKLVQVVQKEQ